MLRGARRLATEILESLVMVEVSMVVQDKVAVDVRDV